MIAGRESRDDAAEDIEVEAVDGVSQQRNGTSHPNEDDPSLSERTPGNWAEQSSTAKKQSNKEGVRSAASCVKCVCVRTGACAAK